MRAWLIAILSPGHWLPWGQLERSIRSAGPIAAEVLGMPLWQYYEEHAVEGRYFAEGMTGVSAMAVQAVLAAYSFAGAQLVIDVGGSQGSFLAAVLQRVSTGGSDEMDRLPCVPTLSCGLSECSAGDTPASLYERADSAQYTAKRQGKNRVVAKEARLLRDLAKR